MSFAYAPSSDVSDAFLLATGRTRAGYLGGLRSETMQFQFNQTLEAKLRSKSDTSPEAGDKIRLLTINASPVDYDFVVAARTHERESLPIHGVERDFTAQRSIGASRAPPAQLGAALLGTPVHSL